MRTASRLESSPPACLSGSSRCSPLRLRSSSASLASASGASSYGAIGRRRRGLECTEYGTSDCEGSRSIDWRSGKVDGPPAYLDPRSVRTRTVLRSEIDGRRASHAVPRSPNVGRHPEGSFISPDFGRAPTGIHLCHRRPRWSWQDDDRNGYGQSPAPAGDSDADLVDAIPPDRDLGGDRRPPFGEAREDGPAGRPRRCAHRSAGPPGPAPPVRVVDHIRLFPRVLREGHRPPALSAAGDHLRSLRLGPVGRPRTGLRVGRRLPRLAAGADPTGPREEARGPARDRIAGGTRAAGAHPVPPPPPAETPSVVSRVRPPVRVGDDRQREHAGIGELRPSRRIFRTFRRLTYRQGGRCASEASGMPALGLIPATE